MLFDLFIKPIVLWCIQRDMGGARTESGKHTREWQRREASRWIGPAGALELERRLQV